MTLPVQLRELADLVEDLEESDVDAEVQDARLDGVAGDGDLFRANVTVLAPMGAENEAVQEAVVDEEADWDEADDLVASDEADAEEDEDASPLDEVVCDVDGCDYSGSKRGLAIHKSRAHADDEDESADAEDDDGEPTLEERIAALLEEHGELPSTEIKLLLETSSEHYRNVLSSMQRADRVKSRQDPEDRRRSLYRLADQEPDDVDGEEQDEAGEASATRPEDNESEGAGTEVNDEVPYESFPRECHCGVTLEDSLELAIHRTEEHDTPQAALGRLEPGEFKSIVEEADALADVVDEVGWSPEKTLRVIGFYDLDDAVGHGAETTVAEESAAADGGPEPDDTEPAPVEESVETDTETLDLADYGTGRDELVDALEGSQTIHHVQRHLNLDRETTMEILSELRLLEKMSGGGPPLTLRDAENAVREVT